MNEPHRDHWVRLVVLLGIDAARHGFEPLWMTVIREYAEVKAHLDDDERAAIVQVVTERASHV